MGALHDTDIGPQPSNLPNLRRLFVEARSEAEESAYSRNAVRCQDPLYFEGLTRVKSSITLLFSCLRLQCSAWWHSVWPVGSDR